MPRSTAVGLLLSEDRETAESAFLLLRELPDDIVVAGRFAPAEGYVRLTREVAALRLEAHGRDADRAPLNDAAAAMAWHVEATRRFWSGEFVEPPA